MTADLSEEENAYKAISSTKYVSVEDMKPTSWEVDLSNYCNASLSEQWSGTHLGHSGNTLDSLPRGLQRFAGVDFNVRGIVQLSSMYFKQFGALYPETVKEINVNRRCQRLHFLHASSIAGGKNGTRIGQYVIHYADGQQREIPIIYGRDMISRIITMRRW